MKIAKDHQGTHGPHHHGQQQQRKKEQTKRIYFGQLRSGPPKNKRLPSRYLLVLFSSLLFCVVDRVFIAY